MKLTKQGVRDLNHLKGKSVGVQMKQPPKGFMCTHRDESGKSLWKETDMGYSSTCTQCGETVDNYK